MPAYKRILKYVWPLVKKIEYLSGLHSKVVKFARCKGAACCLGAMLKNSACSRPKA
ncbi:hypothetical protein HanPSC8_Chr14g0641791 [Helianthus annuus]|nr:hypothetical protein HanPSC8_Chr14g0641791 [Helianthus annuus]